MRYKGDSRREGVALTQHVADTPLAKRMVKNMGDEGFQLLKNLQHKFGARLLHYQDAEGEVGKRPGWANDAG